MDRSSPRTSPAALAAFVHGLAGDLTRHRGRDGDRIGVVDDRGRLVFGGSYRHSDRFTTFTETVFDQPGGQRSLTRAYGVTYTPDPAWVLSGTIEQGTVRDADSGDFDRLALSFGAVHSPSEDRDMRVRLEYRSEDGTGTERAPALNDPDVGAQEKGDLQGVLCLS